RRRHDAGRDRGAPRRVAQDDRQAPRPDPRRGDRAAGGRVSCIGEPISWLRLERHYLAGRAGSEHLAADPGVAAHLDACAACRASMAEITGDVVALPPLVVPARRAVRWWRYAMPALAVAAIAIVIMRPRTPEREDVAVVKGVGEV